MREKKLLNIMIKLKLGISSYCEDEYLDTPASIIVFGHRSEDSLHDFSYH